MVCLIVYVMPPPTPKQIHCTFLYLVNKEILILILYRPRRLESARVLPIDGSSQGWRNEVLAE